MSELTMESKRVFDLYWNDSGNWSGVPWVSRGNITCTREMRGNLSDLVQKRLIIIQGHNLGQYIEFTSKGKQLGKTIQRGGSICT